MFRPVSLYIGLRYTRAKRRNHFISFISLTSMIGIALGVMVLITVLSVMNGFDDAIRDHFFAMAQQVTVSASGNAMTDWKNIESKVDNQPGVVSSAAYVEGNGLLSVGGQTSPVGTFGILPSEQNNVSELPSKMVSGSISDLKAGRFGMIIGQKLAENLGVGVGDKVTLVVPSATFTPVGVFPRFKAFKIVGIFHVGAGFGYDSGLAYINLNDAQKLFLLGNAVSGVQLKLKDFYSAPAIAQTLQLQLPQGYVVSDWTQSYGAIFQAVKLEKTMMFLMLILIIAVAAFNLVSTLVMVVTDKKADIAILRTLGATPRTILAIFMVQGMVVGIVGTLSGLILGVLLAQHVTGIVSGIQHVFHVQIIAKDVYYVNYLPSKLMWSDVWRVCVISFTLCLLATLYPAWRAAKTQPAEALRYE
ncbi:MAG TPA: lipoprotein-releasing ABC transporter permease subunit [Gammaproteobacteria bacterium]|nr:lipoprotein-releasing ABC transporter permease subunit [Gammaproteobacteria bacterium]